MPIYILKEEREKKSGERKNQDERLRQRKAGTYVRLETRETVLSLSLSLIVFWYVLLVALELVGSTLLYSRGPHMTSLCLWLTFLFWLVRREKNEEDEAGWSAIHGLSLSLNVTLMSP